MSAWHAAKLAVRVSVAVAAVAGGDALARATEPATVALENVTRANLGMGLYNAGWYGCSTGYGQYPCAAGSSNGFIPFLVGPQLDLHLGGINNLSVGFDVLVGSVATSFSGGWKTVAIWEPTLDYVAKFGPPTEDTVGRFRIGGGVYVGPNSGAGGTFRIGGGASFLNAGRIGIGVDLVLEAGGYQNNWMGGLQLMASPEWHF
ncbi:MAG TPA: hypothetical protein VMT17_00530 [Anaeromyxobacteraceae bacterium]|nr:hypothetical protein [Anaeromyxobacteraceae bacterium]